MVPSNIPAKLQYYLKIIPIRLHAAYSAAVISSLGVPIGQLSKKPLGIWYSIELSGAGQAASAAEIKLAVPG